MQSIQGPGPTECKPFVEAPDTRSMMRIGLNVLEMVTYSGTSPPSRANNISHTQYLALESHRNVISVRVWLAVKVGAQGHVAHECLGRG
jgi:hypothetical protein